ncbi:flavin reductase [Williamsia sp. Leaf354]|jgi:flavin reductase (DIM6/NTAB) family NADH-FMN oxidoreductase RutF|uniref:flavin reductase family protein n=1 Tax=Williamsia sp. Leaf354 TaxID=1736349 RepID=UPI0006F52AEE|nr:flavin reductase family protein [Williamsia sp. Leaf354]KQR96471.1 flavin reductase [Williamsia sp. Leaf354]
MSSSSDRIVHDPATVDPGDFYKLLTASVVPRPIAWVSSRSSDGIDNLSPYSFFSVSSTSPPVVQFTSVGGAKDSARNAIDTGQFVINIVSTSLMHLANDSSAGFDSDVDEFVEAGIPSTPATVVDCLRVADSPIAIECRLHRSIEVGNSVVIMGEVVALTVDPAIVADDGLPDYDKLAAVSRLGRIEWGMPGETVDLDRPH